MSGQANRTLGKSMDQPRPARTAGWPGERGTKDLALGGISFSHGDTRLMAQGWAQPPQLRRGDVPASSIAQKAPALERLCLTADR